MSKLRLFKYRFIAPYMKHGKICKRRRTQKFKTDSMESAKEYADNMVRYHGCELLWMKEVHEDGTETKILA